MTDIWEKFDKAIDTEALAKDVEEAEKNGGKGDYKEVPHGAYEVSIEKLELTESKKGKPMLTCWMKIISGEFKKSRLFMNQVIEEGFQIHIVNAFVRKLVEELDKPIDIHFESHKQYASLLMDVMEAIDGSFEYAIEYGEKKGFNTFDITEVFPLED